MRIPLLLCAVLLAAACRPSAPGASSNADAALAVLDASVGMDAGSGGLDGAATPDAALVMDAASSPMDAAQSPDAATNAPDAATPPDAAISPDAASPADAATSWRSTLYPTTWTPGLADADGRALQDYSYAGYRNGEEPAVVAGPIFPVVDEGADPIGVNDSSAAIQAAIAKASMAGGVVFFGEGTYRVDSQLTVTASNVVLRGAGAALSRLRFPSVGPDYTANIHVGVGPSFGADLLLTADAARFDTVLKLADASSVQVGMDVAVGQVISAAYIEAHGMTGTWQAFNNTWQPFYRRTVVAVDTSVMPNTVTLDVPLRDPLLMRDGASLRIETGLLREVGVEDLGFSNAVDRAAAWGVNQKSVLWMDGVVDGWVRRIQSFSPDNGDHLQSCGLLVLASKRVTVSESTLERAQNRGGGGNGYLFEVRQSSEVLFRDNTGRAGRHNFIQNWGFGTTGCVFLRCVSTDGRALFAQWDPIGSVGPSEFHHSLATANLIDSSTLNDGWAAGNRGSESTGAGHSASENVFWNVRGTGTIRSLQYGHGYVVGTQDVNVVTTLSYVSVGLSASGTAPEDLVEGRNQAASLEPASLYEDQRARRLMGP